MATLASASLLPEMALPGPAPQARAAAPKALVAIAAEPYERCVYQPSRRSGPVAFFASAGVLLAAIAVLTTLNVVAKSQKVEHLAVVEMKELDTTPPPPPPQQLEKPVVQPPVFVPKPMLELPSPGPTQVALDVPPPAAPPQVTAPTVAVAEGKPTPPAPAAATPLEGGDLSSKVLSAKPPSYPVDARRHREQGTVKLMVLVGPDGRVADIAVASSSGHSRLDQAALSAVKRWRWSPLSRDGAAVSVKGYVTIPFVLV